jgi:hypothetical protein
MTKTQCSGACDYCIWNRPHPGEPTELAQLEESMTEDGTGIVNGICMMVAGVGFAFALVYFLAWLQQ